MIRITGNESVISAVSSMIDSGRIPHSIVIHGEAGLGKKTMARYIAAKLLCKSGQSAPCGVCHSCKMIYGGGHPDFICVKPSLKSGAYKLEEDLREVVSDAVVAPSESRYKVYLIADMDKTPVGSQNALLKLIEEPPDHAVIILTATAKEYFLPTILSRVISLGMTPVSRDECRGYLADNTRFSADEIDDAVSAVGGNIGRCMEYLDGGMLKDAVKISKSISKAIASQNEYEILKAFWACEGKKQLALMVLKQLREIFRDAYVMRLGQTSRDSLLGCSAECAAMLAETLAGKRIASLCEIPEEYIARINGNANLALCLNSVCADIKSAL